MASGQINLQEAAQLARLTARRLGCGPRAAHRRRAELILTPLGGQGAPARRRARIRKILGESAKPDILGGLGAAVCLANKLLDVDPSPV